MKSYLKWLAATLGLICLVVVFQNCSKKNYESTPNATLTGADAQALIGVMESAGIQDPVAINSLALPQKINLSAVNMNCSRLNSENSQQCVFTIKKDDGTTKTVKTSIQTSATVIELLSAVGAKLTCTTDCNDVEGYLVKSVSCTKNTSFPEQSVCKFKK
ncbi:hypothetical protein K2P97_04615 [bacterium]|nr:hypothetical protein [bacterium]